LTKDLDDRLSKDKRKLKDAEASKDLSSQWAQEAARFFDRVESLDRGKLTQIRDHLSMSLKKEVQKLQSQVDQTGLFLGLVAAFDPQTDMDAFIKDLESGSASLANRGNNSVKKKFKKLTLMDRMGSLGSTLIRAKTLRRSTQKINGRATTPTGEAPVPDSNESNTLESAAASVPIVDSEGFSVPPEPSGAWTDAYANSSFDNDPDFEYGNLFEIFLFFSKKNLKMIYKKKRCHGTLQN
jgi:hypothetical protein